MTETGLSLGTPHYMSPEQATAEKEITGRSDIYSLASVMYEMLAGNPPHVGSSAQQIIMKIIAEPVEAVTKFRKSVPPNVAAAVAKALEKLPADRFETAAAFAAALTNATFTAATGHGVNAGYAVSAGWRQRAAVPALAAATVFAVIAAGLLMQRPPAASISRYAVDLPEGKRLGTAGWSPLAVSPDGSKLAYMGETGRLFLRSREQLDLVELAGTEGAFNPFFSRDGKKVGFMSGGAGSAEIKYVTLSGGPPTLVTSSGVGGPGVAWGYDGYIYYDASGVGPLRRVRDTGGQAEDVSVLDTASGELQHNWPDPLPNGRGVVMVIDRAGPGVNVSTTNDVAVIDLRTHKHTILARGVFAKYARSGHLLYVTAGGLLMAAPFDQDRMVLTGAPVSLLEGVSVRRGGGGVDLAISETGTLWYGSGSTFNELESVWATRSGQITPVDTSWAGDLSSIALSRDGSKLAVSIVDATGEQIWVKRLDMPHGTMSKLTFDGVNGIPRWSPDGSQVLFTTMFGVARPLRAVRADGTNPTPVDLVRVARAERVYAATWSPDRRWIVYEALGATGTGRDLFARRTSGDTTPVPLANSKFSERNPSVSPDGRWLLYEATTTGTIEVYVRPFPDVGKGLYQISSGGGLNPKWSRDGHEIFYANQNGNLARVAVVPGNTFAFVDPRVLFSIRGVADWDVAPDGRFIMIRERGGRLRSKLVVVENFFQELNVRVPR
jgi:serine/threonine-protein kinase